ncbi:MAG: hypothetical protein K6T80_07530, partial [Firmicutes bacterium]|nr:hypothetical protein [Bacillota bacterium]
MLPYFNHPFISGGMRMSGMPPVQPPPPPSEQPVPFAGTVPGAVPQPIPVSQTCIPVQPMMNPCPYLIMQEMTGISDMEDMYDMVG